MLVSKPNGTVCICRDFKVFVNAYADIQRYSLPHPKELRAALVSGTVFSKIDIADAYLQMDMDLESRKYLVISTHRGLFRYTRLPFGFHGALAIFQSAIDMILHGLSGVAAYLDDILITGTDEQEHLPRLRWLFQRLLAAGVRLKKEMCSFGLRSLTYLGQVMDCAGTRPDPTKVRQSPTA